MILDRHFYRMLSFHLHPTLTLLFFTSFQKHAFQKNPTFFIEKRTFRTFLENTTISRAFCSKFAVNWLPNEEAVVYFNSSIKLSFSKRMNDLNRELSETLGESNSKSRKSKSDNHKRSIYAAVGWNPKNQAQNRSFKFPEDLVLGPEQLQVINQKLKSKLTILAGEAGCGKTTTLLALLFKYSGKHVTSKKLKKIVFFIPEEKKDFRRDVKNFIKTNCQPEWVEVSPLRSLEKLTVNYENLYLIDEYYGSGPELAKFLSYTSGNFFIALISAQSSHGSISSGFEIHTSSVFFRRTYRTPEPISRISSKLRRLIDRNKDGKDSHRNIPWAMSFYNGAPMNTRYPFKFLSYSDCSRWSRKTMHVFFQLEILKPFWHFDCQHQLFSELKQVNETVFVRQSTLGSQ